MKQNFYAAIAAFIWGTAFIAQEQCSKNSLGPFTVNALRSVIAAVVLAIIVVICRKTGITADARFCRKNQSLKPLLVGGVCCGIALAAASNLQQAGIAGSGSGKSAFITAMYIVIVPLLGLFRKKKVPFRVWGAVGIAVVGFYFLCLFGKGSTGLALSDLYVLICSVVFAIHILIVDYFSADTNGVELSCVQFIVVGMVSSICMLVFERPDIDAIMRCAIPILYIAVFSSGVAYTLQILAQKNSNPTVITLILSLESVFALLAEMILPGYGKEMKWQEITGCLLIFTAVILSQLPAINIKKGNKKNVQV